MFIGECVAEHLIIGAEIFDLHSGFWNPRGSTCLEDIDRLSCESFGDPTLDWSPPEPFILEVRELFQILKRVHFLERIEIECLCFLKPEGRTRFGAEMPMDDSPYLLVELFLGLAELLIEFGHGRDFSAENAGEGFKKEGSFPVIVVSSPLAGNCSPMKRGIAGRLLHIHHDSCVRVDFNDARSVA